MISFLVVTLKNKEILLQPVSKEVEQKGENRFRGPLALAGNQRSLAVEKTTIILVFFLLINIKRSIHSSRS